jgi:hypothetical protein
MGSPGDGERAYTVDEVYAEISNFPYFVLDGNDFAIAVTDWLLKLDDDAYWSKLLPLLQGKADIVKRWVSRVVEQGRATHEILELVTRSFVRH